MKVGDLVKYKEYHKNLQKLRGIVISPAKRKDRVFVFWNHIRWSYEDNIEDWIEDLEVVSQKKIDKPTEK